ncbi:MAG: SH3 domain-containing protein [Chloroflexota bacterium]
MMIRKAKIIEAHERTYETAIIVKQGQSVTCMKRDLWDDTHMWVWCKADDDGEGWIPLECLHLMNNNSATVNRDFNAIELTVAENEIITVHEEVAGWCWSENKKGDTGWIPYKKIDYCSK